MTNTPTKAPNEQARIELPHGYYFEYHRADYNVTTGKTMPACYDLFKACKMMGGAVVSTGWHPDAAQAFAAAMNTPPQTNGQAGGGELRAELKVIAEQLGQSRKGHYGDHTAKTVTINEAQEQRILQALATPAPAAGVPDSASIMRICEAYHQERLSIGEPTPVQSSMEDERLAAIYGEKAIASDADHEAAGRFLWENDRAPHWHDHMDAARCMLGKKLAALIAARCQQYAEQHGGKREAEMVAVLESLEGGLELARMGVAAEESRTDTTFRINDMMKEVQKALAAAKARGGNSGE